MLGVKCKPKKKVGLPFLDCYMNLATEPAAYCVSGKRLQILLLFEKKYMYLSGLDFIDVSCYLLAASPPSEAA